VRGFVRGVGRPEAADATCQPRTLKPVATRPFEGQGSLDLNGIDQSVPSRGLHRRADGTGLNGPSLERAGSHRA